MEDYKVREYHFYIMETKANKKQLQKLQEMITEMKGIEHSHLNTRQETKYTPSIT